MARETHDRNAERKVSAVTQAEALARIAEAAAAMTREASQGGGFQ